MHLYLSTAWHESYARRTAVECAFASIKDPAGENINRGSIRLLGLAKISLVRAFAWAARNRRILRAFTRN